MDFDGTLKGNPRRLAPGSGWEAASTIWHLALEGMSLRRIACELGNRGFLTATGRTLWRPTTVWQVLNNPVYAGRYYALRYEAVAPRKRSSAATYGKSSQRLRRGGHGADWDARSASWVWLKDVVVESPMVTWEDFLLIQERMDRNKALALASATSKRFYLLRGMVICQLCGATYMGKAHRQRYVYYVCGRCRKKTKGAPQCSNRPFPGKELEAKVWQVVSSFLSSPETVMAEIERKEGDSAAGEDVLRRDLSALDKRQAALDGQETELVSLRVRKAEDGTPLVSDAAFERNLALIKAQRSWIADERQRIGNRLVSLRNRAQAAREVLKVQALVKDKLANAGPDDMRRVLEALNTRVLVWPDRIQAELGVAIPVTGPDNMDTVSTRPEG